jgi:amino acid transporter
MHGASRQTTVAGEPHCSVTDGLLAARFWPDRPQNKTIEPQLSWLSQTAANSTGELGSPQFGIRKDTASHREETTVHEPVTLKRGLGLPMVTFYGLGTIVGGGFYALVGKVALEAGMLTPLAFLAAALIATFSAFSYAELSARYPYSAGEAHYVLVAFRRAWPSGVVGWAVIATGIVSAATLADAFSGFVRSLIDIPDWLVIGVMVLGLGLVAAWGIGQSAVLALIITLLELAGLLAVIFAAGDNLATVPERWRELTPNLTVAPWTGILLGAYLAFYSFVGFEDMVNVAEEVKRPERNLPIAILGSLAITTCLYVLVTLTVVLTVPQTDLTTSDSPLSLVFAKGGRAAATLTGVGMLSGLNGALVQIVMASRVSYGLAQKQLAPKTLAIVHPYTRTPLRATIMITIIVLVLAIWLPIVALAKVTSTVLLVVYAIVNLSLLVIRFRRRRTRTDGPVFPIAFPIIGLAACIAFLLFHAVMTLAR